jgi:uncharacterized protein DUF6970
MRKKLLPRFFVVCLSLTVGVLTLEAQENAKGQDSPRSGKHTEAHSPTARPAWVETLITSLRAAPVANPPAAIVRYQYKGQRVYYVPSRCCDIPGRLFDERGEELCMPDVGITGWGDGRCRDFFTEQQDEHVVWKDERHGQK